LQWNQKGKVTSVSIYFATGYFGNPASFFGHPLLKFNSDGIESPLNDTSLNYGANTPENENPVLYVLKGLFGGYKASFSHLRFFHHNHNYIENDMRDLWEFKLNLKPDEIEYIVDHTWEILGQDHPYFFLLDNCAYRMGELLEEVFHKELLFRNRLYVIPVDLFTNLALETREDGSPIVKEIKRTPSRYSRLSEKYNSLGPTQKKIVKDLIENTEFSNLDYQKQNAQEKVQIIDTLMDYFSFRQLKESNPQLYAEARSNTIKERFQIPEKANFSFYDRGLRAQSPHLGVNTFNVKLTQGQSYFNGAFQEINLRQALYDELNPSVGRPDNTSLVVFDTRLQVSAREIELRQLDIFRISNLSVPETDLPGESKMSWKAQLGIKSQSLLCHQCQVGFFTGGVGHTLAATKNISIYALGKINFQTELNSFGTLSVGPEIGSFLELFPIWKISASYEQELFQNGQKSRFDVWKVEHRFGNSPFWDIRLQYLKHEDEQYRASFGWYL